MIHTRETTGEKTVKTEKTVSEGNDKDPPGFPSECHKVFDRTLVVRGEEEGITKGKVNVC